MECHLGNYICQHLFWHGPLSTTRPVVLGGICAGSAAPRSAAKLCTNFSTPTIRCWYLFQTMQFQGILQLWPLCLQFCFANLCT